MDNKDYEMKNDRSSGFSVVSALVCLMGLLTVNIRQGMIRVHANVHVIDKPINGWDEEPIF